MKKTKIYNFRLLGLLEGQTTESVVRPILRSNEEIVKMSEDRNVIQIRTPRINALCYSVIFSGLENTGYVTYAKWEDAVNPPSQKDAFVLVNDGIDIFPLNNPPLGMENFAKQLRELTV